MQSRSQWDSEKVSAQSFFLRLLSYSIFILNLTASQIIEGWANQDSLLRSRLYIFLILRRLLCLFGSGFTLNIKQGLCFLFSRFPR